MGVRRLTLALIKAHTKDMEVYYIEWVWEFYEREKPNTTRGD